MAQPVQKRALQTRAKMIAAAEEIVAESSLEALRVEDVVKRAGVAKGTFFAHFHDKEALMDLIIGPRIDAVLDDLAEHPAPQSAEELADALIPLCELVTCERYAFDVIFRYSGAASIEEIGPIAATFGRQIEVFAELLEDGPFRDDISPSLLAEGVQAFMLQAAAAKFCALHNAISVRDRLVPYLKAWLTPASAESELEWTPPMGMTMMRPPIRRRD